MVAVSPAITAMSCGLDAELLGADLRERRLDALPHRHRAGIERDPSRPADAHDAGFERPAPGSLHAIGDAEAEIAASRARVALAFGEAGVVDRIERHLQAAREIAAVKGDRRTGAVFSGVV